jgi:outer membrane protein TolC
MRGFCGAAVLGLLTGGGAWAAEGTKPELLDLRACIDRAVVAAPEIATAKAQLGVREGELHKAKASRFVPEAGMSNLLSPARDASGKLGSELPSEHVVKEDTYGPFYRLQIGFVQPLWTAGKITAGINAATAGVLAEQAARSRTTAEVVERTKILYYNVLLARAVRGVVEDSNDAFAKAVEKARERREQNDPNITELDILNLRAAAAEVAKEMPRLEAAAETALEALRRMMGYAPEAAVDVKDTRLEPDATALAPLDQYEAKLFASSPEWSQVNAGVTAKEEEVKRALADYYPQVFVKGGFDYGIAPGRRRQTNPFVYDDYNYTRGPGAGLGVGWKLNFHITAADVAIKRAELLAVESERRSAQTGLPVELRATYRKALQARQQIDDLGEGRKAARAILTFSVANFDVGVGDPAAILQGLGLYSRVSSDYYEVVRDYNLALAALGRIMGETTAGPAVPAEPKG